MDPLVTLLALLIAWIMLHRILSRPGKYHLQPIGKYYRLGDAFKKRSYLGNWKRHVGHQKKDSLAYQYMRATPKDHQWPVMEKLVTERMRKKDLRGFVDRLVVHLRLGDCIWKIGKQGGTPRRCAEGTTRAQYHGLTMPNAPEIISVVKENKLKGVVLIGGTHTYKSIRESVEYVKNLEQLLADAEIKVTIRLNGDPDDDFCLMAASSHFMQSPGGYSRLIAQLVRRQGHKAFDRLCAWTPKHFKEYPVVQRHEQHTEAMPTRDIQRLFPRN